MNGYAASARIDRAPVRARLGSGSAAMALSPADRWTDERLTPATLSERIEDWRILWEQTTFFLFDPESWRR
ncbi:MAG TPA: hypothetical protein VJZ72_07280 [Candidatus Limnocylindrales bacterium]|nr:hypothetical protein [Candidatus Limnocylindrales bacterium]